MTGGATSVTWCASTTCSTWPISEATTKLSLTPLTKASGYQLVAPVGNKRPDVVLHAFVQLWIVPLGVPHNILSDNVGEFDAEFSEELESIGARILILSSASYAPTQNATCERRGGAWKAPGTCSRAHG